MHVTCTYAICQTGLDFFFVLILRYSESPIQMENSICSHSFELCRGRLGVTKNKTPFSSLRYTVLYIYTQCLHIALVTVTIIVTIIYIYYIGFRIYTYCEVGSNWPLCTGS